MHFNEFLQHAEVRSCIAALPGASPGARADVLDLFAAAFPELPRTRLRAILPAAEALTVPDEDAISALWQALDALPPDRMNDELGNIAVRMLRDQYGPRFNDDPQGTLATVEGLSRSAGSVMSAIYGRLHAHYTETLALKDFLEGYIAQRHAPTDH
jgi:hypothetical protein